MENEKFIQLVADMRKHQKNYFRYRDHLSLQKSKKAEKEVDAEIVRLTGTGTVDKSEPPYPTLF